MNLPSNANELESEEVNSDLVSHSTNESTPKLNTAMESNNDTESGHPREENVLLPANSSPREHPSETHKPWRAVTFITAVTAAVIVVIVLICTLYSSTENSITLLNSKKVRTYLLSVKCEVNEDEEIGRKIIIEDDESYSGARLSLRELNCTGKEPYFVAEVTNPTDLHAFMSSLSRPSSIGIRNKTCDSLQHWSLEPPSKGNETRRPNNVKGVILDSYISLDCTARFLKWFVAHYDSKRVKRLKILNLYSKLTLFSFFANEFNGFLKQSPRIQEISLNTNFIMGPELFYLFNGTNLRFLTDLEITGPTFDLSKTFVKHILLNLQNCSLRKISIGIPILAKDCEYYSLFKNTLTNLSLTIDIENSYYFDFEKCFEHTPDLDSVAIRLVSNYCESLEDYLYVKGVRRYKTITNSVQIAFTSQCKLIMDES